MLSMKTPICRYPLVRCPLSSKRPINLISLSLSLTGKWTFLITLTLHFFANQSCEVPQYSADLEVYPGIILCMCPANGRQRCNVMWTLIGWAHTQNDPWHQISDISNFDQFTWWLKYLSQINDRHRMMSNFAHGNFHYKDTVKPLM